MQNSYYKWVGISETICLWLIELYKVNKRICRKVKFFLEILLSTPSCKFIISLVKILVIYDNPQITKARSEYFKPCIKQFMGLSMWVGISETIRLWSIFFLFICHALQRQLNYLWMLIRNCSFCLTINIITFLSTINLSKLLNYVLYFNTTNAALKKEILKTEEHDNSPLVRVTHENNEEIHEEVDEDESSEINEEVDENSRSLPATQAHENFYDIFASDPKENGKFFEWLAGIIDGDGCFLVSKKGYCSLEIVTQLRDKKILYLIKQKFGGSVKLVSGKNFLRYRLHHKAGLLNLIYAVNGLLRNPTRILQLGKICSIYGVELKDPKSLTYNSGWLAGFIDTDGSVYLNEASGQIFITAVQKNRFILEALVELYGGTIYPMVKQEAFKWTCYKKT